MAYENKKSNRFLVWSILFLTLFILGIFSYLVSKEIKKKKQVENEINSLKEESKKIEKENLELEDRIFYLGSQDYQKMQAKDKLNLRDSEESVIVIAEEPVKKEELSLEQNAKPSQKMPPEPNYLKWWKYFFK